jgi:hypothetical protein
MPSMPSMPSLSGSKNNKAFVVFLFFSDFLRPGTIIIIMQDPLDNYPSLGSIGFQSIFVWLKDLEQEAEQSLLAKEAYSNVLKQQEESFKKVGALTLFRLKAPESNPKLTQSFLDFTWTKLAKELYEFKDNEPRMFDIILLDKDKEQHEDEDAEEAIIVAPWSQYLRDHKL